MKPFFIDCTLPLVNIDRFVQIFNSIYRTSTITERKICTFNAFSVF